MQEVDFKAVGVTVGAITGCIGLTKLVIQPLIKAWKRYRELHPPFRKTVLRSLEQLQKDMKRNDDYNAALLRERLESAYTVYVLRMGWCPSGEKRMLMDLFDLYTERGWNHLNKRYQEHIMALPETAPDEEREEKTK